MDFEVIYRKYHAPIWHYCTKLLLSKAVIDHKELAEDFLQESWMAAYERWSTFKNEYNAKNFVYLCVKNKCFNEFDRIKRHTKGDKELQFISSDIQTPLDYDMINADVIGFIWSIMGKLPPARQQVIKLFFKGFTSDEIAAELHITRKTALNHKLTAIDNIKKALRLRFG
jgi:RNA polymerase sigma factor (sigma-70 family)